MHTFRDHAVQNRSHQVKQDNECLRGVDATHRTKGDSSRSQAYEASISGMRLVNSISILADKLLYDGPDLFIITSGNQLSDDLLEPVDCDQLGFSKVGDIRALLLWQKLLLHPHDFAARGLRWTKREK